MWDEGHISLKGIIKFTDSLQSNNVTPKDKWMTLSRWKKAAKVEKMKSNTKSNYDGKYKYIDLKKSVFCILKYKEKQNTLKL